MERQAKSLQKKAKVHQVDHAGGGKFWVTSASSGKRYLVSELANGGFACTCDWGHYHRTDLDPCSHVLAVEEYLEQAGGRSLSFWSDKEAARKQHRPIRYMGRGLLATSRGG
jgi:hypothetical protein